MKYIKSLLSILVVIVGVLLITKRLEFEEFMVISSSLIITTKGIDCWEYYKNNEKKKAINSGILMFLWGLLFISAIYTILFVK